jgi:hypothetical protein
MYLRNLFQTASEAQTQYVSANRGGNPVTLLSVEIDL